VENLEGGGDKVSARNLKYAVLHLAAGAEVLLKARLQMEHWSLVFTNPGQATKQALADGSLSSCGPDETRQRLTNIVGIPFGPREKEALSDLAKSRNALQHYGLVGENANAQTVESTTARVLNFLIQFFNGHILPNLEDNEERRSALADMERITAGLHMIQGYVEERMRDLAPTLGPVRASTVQCPECKQWAFTSAGDWPKVFAADPKASAEDVYTVHCHFCGISLNPMEAAYTYAMEILGGYRHSIDDSDSLPEECPECRADSLVRGANTAKSFDYPVDFCFGCATPFNALENCPLCGGLQSPGGKEHRCHFLNEYSFWPQAFH
jgi:hypothetical protein